MSSIRDTGVVTQGDSLQGRRILLGVSGGIAAVESVKVARELRRHGAEVLVIMTHSAQKMILPLALKWASAADVISDWEGDMKQLDDVDAVLVTPATRHLMACMVQGMMDTPLLMALSAARGRDVPIMLAPSMHEDLAEDPLTREVEEGLARLNMKVHWGDANEGKRKQEDHIALVAHLAHHVNSYRDNRKEVVITLGATRSAIDDVRYIQNTSSGRTGWSIAEHLFRHGHDVTVVAGATTADSAFRLPLVIEESDPDGMLKELKALSNDSIDAWIHVAAVLDYIVSEPIEGKFGSQQGSWTVGLAEGAKHIKELEEYCRGAVRIGFKLESGIKMADLVHRALAQIRNSGMTAVIANRLEDLTNPEKPRAHLVDHLGEHWALADNRAVADAIRTLVERGLQ